MNDEALMAFRTPRLYRCLILQVRFCQQSPRIELKSEREFEPWAEMSHSIASLELLVKCNMLQLYSSESDPRKMKSCRRGKRRIEDTIHD